MSGKVPILYVEDDPNDVLLVGLAFRKAGVPASLRILNDGEQAVEYLSGEGTYADRQAHPLPALLLLDLKLPRRSGLEVVSWLRRRDDLRRLPVVMLTSSSQRNDVNRAYDVGVNSYLVKPSALEELTGMVKRLSEYWLEMNARPILNDAEE